MAFLLSQILSNREDINTLRSEITQQHDTLMTVNEAMRLKTILLPSGGEEDASKFEIVLMRHPRTGAPTRYLRKINLRPEASGEGGKEAGSTSIYELTEIGGSVPTQGGRAPRPRADQLAESKARSFLVVDNATVTPDFNAGDEKEEVEEKGFVLESPKLIIPTQVNPLFFTLNTLNAFKDKFQQLELLHDNLETNAKTSKDCKTLSYAQFQKAILPIVDELEGTPEFVKLSTDKLFGLLDRIAERIVAAGLPGDIYQKFVVDALSTPITESTTVAADDPKNPQDSVTTSPGNSEFTDSAIRRTAMSLVCSHVPPALSRLYFESATARGHQDFAKLDAHLDELKVLRSAASVQHNALAQQGLNVASRKRTGGGMADLGLEKKVKTAMTKGERAMQKVNKAGIKTLTSFFSVKKKA